MKRLLYGKSYRPYYAAITENNFKKSNKQDLIMLHRILKKTVKHDELSECESSYTFMVKM